MKKKLLIYILVLIFLYFVGCINEMEMLEDNSTLKAGNERLFMPDSLRDLIEYDRNSMDQYSIRKLENILELLYTCLLYTSPSPRDSTSSRMPSSA